MLRWALDQSRARKARRAAGARIAPLVENSRRRLGALPDAVWSDPYIIGFMMMLITTVARMEIGQLEGQALCDVQAKTWADITMQSHAIGEEVILLSAARNPDFELGCRNAMALRSVIVGNLQQCGAPATEWSGNFDGRKSSPPTPLPCESVLLMWEEYFDTHVSVYLHYVSGADTAL